MIDYIVVYDNSNPDLGPARFSIIQTPITHPDITPIYPAPTPNIVATFETKIEADLFLQRMTDMR
jgi:hypothetical protein